MIDAPDLPSATRLQTEDAAEDAPSDEWRCQFMLHLHPIPDSPIDASRFFTEVDVAGGRVEFWVERGPRLRVRVCPPNGPTYTFVSRQLIFTNDESFEAAVLCNSVKALLWINGQPGGATGFPPDDDGPSYDGPLEVRLPEQAVSTIAEAQRFCNEGSKAAREARHSHRTQVRTKPGRRPLNRGEIFESLRKEMTQLRQLLMLINGGSLEHVYGISARIRSLACYMKNRNDLPLLQYCASYYDLPLLIYATPPHWCSYGNQPDIEISGRIYPEHIVGSLLELDFDYWLCLEAFRYKDTSYSANDVVRSFADTMGGAHHDKSVDPKIEELLKHSRRSFGAPGAPNMMCAFILEVSVCVLSLGLQVASHATGQPL